MTVAKLAYLTTPSPGVVVLNIQPEGSDGIIRYEITQGHLARILIAGTSLAFAEQTSFNRVPETQTTENAHDTDRRQLTT